MLTIEITPTPDTSISHSLAATPDPVFKTNDLAHLSSAYVVFLVFVLTTLNPIAMHKLRNSQNE